MPSRRERKVFAKEGKSEQIGRAAIASLCVTSVTFAVGFASVMLSISQSEFVRACGIGQLAPGPNMLVVLVMGQRVAGQAGALVVAVAAAFFLR